MTAILTQRCDPFGIETERYGDRLAGGLFPEATVGQHYWYCENQAYGRYRFYCKGGLYGFSRANDGGAIPGYNCKGGHPSGEPMILCRIHVAQFSAQGYAPPKPLKTPTYDANGRAQHWAAGSVVGGTRVNDMCPRCIAPPGSGVREAMDRANFLQAQLSRMMMIGILSRIAAIQSELDQVRAKLDEMNERGISHKCPLILREVS